MKQAVTYTRISTGEQNINSQILFLQSWANANDFTITCTFSDLAVSGNIKATERPGFRAMLNHIQSHKTDAVLTFEISRVGRNMLDTITSINLIDTYSTLISCSPKEAWLTTTDPSIRRLLTSILSWVSERERLTLIERTRAGMARARQEGKHIGRSPVILDEKQILSMLLKGQSVYSISKALNVSKTTLYKKLHSIKGDTPRRANCVIPNLSSMAQQAISTDDTVSIYAKI